jgi:hypothetical protein
MGAFIKGVEDVYLRKKALPAQDFSSSKVFRRPITGAV